MDDPPSVNVLKGQADLDEPVEDVCLREGLLVLDLSLDMVGHVSDFAVLHDDNELFKRKVTLFVRNYVWVLQILQQVNFKHGAFLFLLLQTLQHDFLGDVLLVLCLVSYQIG